MILISSLVTLTVHACARRDENSNQRLVIIGCARGFFHSLSHNFSVNNLLLHTFFNNTQLSIISFGFSFSLPFANWVFIEHCSIDSIYRTYCCRSKIVIEKSNKLKFVHEKTGHRLITIFGRIHNSIGFGTVRY